MSYIISIGQFMQFHMICQWLVACQMHPLTNNMAQKVNHVPWSRTGIVTLPAQPQGTVSDSFLYTGAFTCACILFFYGSSFFLSSFFCQPYNLMYLRAALIDFNETWSQWSMTQPAYVIWPLTGSKVIQGHGGQKGHFHQKRIKSLGLCSMVL